jgi:alkanesulfonate monooxygenase SsuD/methylene tetrahydromethanopterin reductase-like flavin-dependent oxidoreductase (luciferase family)
MPWDPLAISFTSGTIGPLKGVLASHGHVITLANPVRTVENAGFVDILSGGRVVLGVGSGYRKYEFDGFGARLRGAP